VKPPRFEYAAPSSLDEALALKAEHGGDAVVLAGGQSLVPLLNLRMAFPEIVIDLGRVAELSGIRQLNGDVAVGAMTRQRELERSELVAERCLLATRAVAHVGHVTIRNRGTVGGSIAHADPAAELPAVALAADAELVARSTRGERTIPAGEFFRGVFSTALEPDELLVEVRFPGAPPSTGAGFVELARRHGDFALVGVGASVTRDGDGSIADARLVFIGVGATPMRASEAEAMLRGQSPEPALLADAARHAAERLDPGSDAHASGAYRRRVAATLAERALKEAAR
jgi:aerobic carbon-monoxide dehydrogenase medium subunit